MKFQKLDLQRISDDLREQCPFVLFAMLTGLNGDGRPKWLDHPEISVFVAPGTGTWHALEQLLPVLAATEPGVLFDVMLLNRLDPATRFRALHGTCLFVRDGESELYRRFVLQSGLDYRIMRARGRRMGLIDNF